MTDPFGLARLRAAALDAWTASPTRLIEDTAAERELAEVGYRDRLLVELVQNAADAAVLDGATGSVVADAPGDGTLHVANTGAPLTAAGVVSLASLRASEKVRAGEPGSGDRVGRFGVGFAAVAAVADEVEVRSTSGSVLFSRARTADALAERGVVVAPGDVPLLRLPFESAEPPRAGFATEVVLRLTAGVDVATLLDAGVAVPLLLGLPAVGRITIGATRFERVERAAELVVIVTGEPDVVAGERRFRRWPGASADVFAELDERGRIVAAPEAAVLYAPTPSAVPLSLPAIVVTRLPTTPDRRELFPGTEVAPLARDYADAVVEFGVALLPEPGLGAGPVDAELRGRVLTELAGRRWLPGGDPAEHVLLVPSRARLVRDLSPALATLLADRIGDLVVPELSGPGSRRRLAALGVTELTPSGLADELASTDADPAWWGRLYGELAALVPGPDAADVFGALPVPLARGGRRIGARGTFVLDGAGSAAPSWLPVVHPDAVDPLLTRLGAESLSAYDALTHPALVELVHEMELAESSFGGVDIDLTREVLVLARRAPGASLGDRLGRLPVPDVDGELADADELIVPGSPLAGVVADDVPFGLVDPAWLDEFGAEALGVIGVAHDFAVVHDALPTGPDHDLDDEDAWWAGLAEPPDRLVAVRDLDLVDPARWPAALAMLAAGVETAPLLADRDGHTAWWLRRHAVLDPGGSAEATPLRLLRDPDASDLAGLFDPLPDIGVSAEALGALLADGVVDDAETAAHLLERLGDPDVAVTPGAALAAHAALADAYRAGRLDLDALAPPRRVRTLAGTAVDRKDAVVIDRPWFAEAIEPERAVAASAGQGLTGGARTASALADVLDVPCASEESAVHIVSTGRASRWSDEPALVRAAVAAGLPVPPGPVVVHPELVVDAGDRRLPVPWWRDERGVVHLTEGAGVPPWGMEQVRDVDER